MKKRPLTTSFDELMKNHYGGRRADRRRDIAGSADRLFARYYGAPAGGRVRKGKAGHAAPLSLGHDDGEAPPQQQADEQFDEYVVGQSVADGEFEEYVVEAGPPSEEYGAAEGPQSAAASFSLEASAGGKFDAIPSDEVSPAQEYQVEILPPPAGEQSRAQERPSSGQSREPYAAQSSLPEQGAGQSGSADDDFMADMQSILSGQMVYDPNRKKTVRKDEPGQQQRDSDRGRGGGEPPAPDAGNTQAIFDRIAQSMQYANAYDLGTVELENRFADFDRHSEREEQAVREKRAKPRPKPPAPAAAGVAAAAVAAGEAAAADSADFIRDLDAIKQKAAGSYGPPSAPVALSLSLDGASRLGTPDAGCIPLALSLSLTDNPADYSRPLYETGEHAQTGWDLYTDQLRVGKSPGVLFSYGELISMGDLYQTASDMISADVGELQQLKQLIRQSTAHYTGKGTADVKDDEWEKVTKSRFLELAEDNYHHFSPDYLFAETSWGKNVGRKPHNKGTWEMYHRWAIEDAQKMFLDPGNAAASVFPELPLIINAFGDHFLTDAFSAGHVINKEAVIEYYKYNFYDGNSLKSASEKFFDRVAELAFRGQVKDKFSVLETYEGVIPLIGTIPLLDWGHPNISSADRFSTLLQKIAEQKPDQIGNLAVKALHDRLNRDGIEVTNDAGDGTWSLTGDGTLNDYNLKIIQKAVQQSVGNINDPSIRAANLDFQTYFTKVWNHVPRLTEASKAKVRQLAKDYTSPDSALLIKAAADLIYQKCDLLIKKLVEAKKLRPET